jgi:hypothetical protein
MLYYIKGETVELCKWTVDIGSLPSFQENANMPAQNGFYTGESVNFGLYCTGKKDETIGC